MSFVWKNYIDVAVHLQDTLDSEASYRSGVSRAYYSVFGKAKLFCLNKLKIITNYEANSSKCHTLIIERLELQEDLELFELSQKIESIKTRRIEADYEPFSPKFTKGFLNNTIQRSLEIHEFIENY